MEKLMLVLSPHPDDAELGAGGSIARWLEEGWEIHVAIFSDCEASLPTGAPKDLLLQEHHSSMEKLGISTENRHIFTYPVRCFPEHRQEILENFVELKRRISPSRVLLPSSQDQHQDHQVVFAEGNRAFRSSATLLGYELPWNISVLTGNHFVELERRHINKKIEAVSCYESQAQLGRPYFKEGFIESLAIVRGVPCQFDYSETFEVVRSRE